MHDTIHNDDELQLLREKVLVKQELERRQIDEACAANPLYWLQNHTKTENPKHAEQDVPFRAPFPRKSYFDVLMKYLMREKRLYIPKSREMLTSWLACGYATWAAQWRPGTFVVMQTEAESKVKGLIRYCKILYENQPEWMKAKYLLTGESMTELQWKNK